MPQRPFNPLDLEALTKVFITELIERPCVALTGVARDRVLGPGLYALYYAGDFAPYGPISAAGCDWPIYLGSALPSGSRTGITERRAGKPPLLERLERHAASVSYAENLEAEDFGARWVEVDEPFIILGEILLLRWYRPLWNSTVAGFGAKVVGGRRTSGRRSRWDTLHPGRPGTGESPGYETSDIEAEIAEHLARFPPRWSESVELSEYLDTEG
jgi:hypothetical protein